MPKLFATVLLLICGAGLHAQNLISDSAFVDRARNQAISSYYKFTGNQARLYNGLDHSGYFNSIKGTAYYLNDSLLNGSIHYDGLSFSPVLMKYDLYKDEVVIKHFSGLQISLLSEKIKEFNFRDHHFVRYIYDSIARVGIPTGIYDHLYEGKKMLMLVRRVKKLEEKVTDEISREFISDDRYYMFRDGKYISFKSKKSFLKLFGSRAREVKKQLRRSGIRYKANREAAILEGAKYYDSLN